MKANLATWFVSLQWQETCACSSLGFRAIKGLVSVSPYCITKVEE
jgi:hypothetical protein